MASKDPLTSLEGDMLDVAPGVKQVNGDISAAEHVERLPNVADGSRPAVNGNTKPKEVQDCDVLVVGAGFSKFIQVDLIVQRADFGKAA